MEDVGIFMAIWSILQLFGIFLAIWYTHLFYNYLVFFPVLVYT
jgi:hypothetical protein